MARLDIPLPEIAPDIAPEAKGLIQIAHFIAGLVRVHAGFESAQAQVEMATGKPVCTPGCGLCCKSHTPHSWELEAGYMVSLLYGDERKRQEILRRSRAWLNSQRNINSQAGIVAATNTPCPYLSTTMGCLVYDGRPLSCRSYSVTTAPDGYCKREKGRGEMTVPGAHTWAIFDCPELGELQESVETLYYRIKDHRMGSYTFLPILALVESGQKVGPVPVARIPLANLWQDPVRNINHGSIVPLVR